MNLRIPEKCFKVLWAPIWVRFKILFGGRGSGKSWSVARYLLLKAVSGKYRILCTREIQNSIKDSVYRLLVDQIYELKLQSFFTIKADTIQSFCGSEFLFKGLHNNISEVKSTEGIDICWVEEAERVSRESWDVLIPTIRNEGSEIIIVFNPEDEKSDTYTRFIERDGKPVDLPDALRELVNFEDNKWFPEVLRKEMEYCRRVDPEKFEHVWMGKPKKYGDALIFKNKIEIREFEAPEGIELYYGADFGFSQDPSVLGRMFIKDNCLWIEYEAYGVGVEITDLPSFYRSVPGSEEWTITADSERPDTISYLSREGFTIEGAKKGKGSVEDGIQFLRSFEKIIIHPRCKGAIGDFTNYRWKKDRITDAILPVPKEGSDHWPDTARYALEKYIKNDVTIYDIL